MKRTSVITGVGCISPLGNTSVDFCREMDRWLTGPASAPEDQRQNCNESKARMVCNFTFFNQALFQKYPRLDISCQYILQATQQAMAEAGLTPEVIPKYRVGIIIGSTHGLLDSQAKFLKMLYTTGKASPMYFQQTANNLLSGIIACQYRIDGLNTTLYNGWTAGLDSIMLAGQLIAANQLDLAIAGGVEILNETIISQYQRSIRRKTLRESFIPGEGAGVIILEAAEIVSQRNQKIIGQVVGGGQETFFRKRDYQTRLSGIFNTSQPSCYFGNRNGTRLDDYEIGALEHTKIRTVFLKPFIGECGAASGVLQTIYALHSREKKSLIVNAASGQISSIVVQGL